MDNNLGNKHTMAKNIKHYMSLNNKTRKEMCDILGVPYTTFTSWITEQNYPRIDKIEKMAQVFNITKADLVEERTEDNSLPPYPNILPIKTKKFPLLGEIACGEPIFATEGHESYVEAGADIRADFCLKAKGDSMTGARIMDGDIVFIRKQSMVNNGQIAAVIIDDEATLKRVYYYPEKGKLMLQAENPSYEPLMYVGEELNQIRIIGLAVAFQSDVR